MKSNCLIYAVSKWIKEGGYIKIRNSNSFPVILHFLHESEDGIVTHFQPTHPIKGWRALFHKVYFNGEIVVGDSITTNKNKLHK